MSNYQLLENGFLMLKKDQSYASPIATLFYEEYISLEHAKEILEADTGKIQCVVSNGCIKDSIAFGRNAKASTFRLCRWCGYN